MSLFKGKFESARQDWTTPDNVYIPLHIRYSFTFDLAADVSNTKCTEFFSETDNALSRPWYGSCWLNPPYGGGKANKLERWIHKASIEVAKPDCQRVVMLIPARTNTNWWHKYCMQGKEILFIQGRPKFGGAMHGLPQPLAVVCFEQAEEPCRFLTFHLNDGVIIQGIDIHSKTRTGHPGVSERRL